MAKFQLCHECACEVVSDDTSGRDLSDMPAEEHEYRNGNIKSMGHAVLVSKIHDGVFTCYVCEENVYAEASIFESDAY